MGPKLLKVMVSGSSLQQSFSWPHNCGVDDSKRRGGGGGGLCHHANDNQLGKLHFRRWRVGK